MRKPAAGRKIGTLIEPFGGTPLGMSRGYVALFLGLLAVSTSGPFFVMAHMSAYTAVAFRTLLAGVLGLVIAQLRGALDLRRMLRHKSELALGGVLLGAHFLLWIKAFDLTDYASNLLLLVSQPVVATLLARMLGEATPRNAWIAVALSVFGLVLIAGADISLGPRALLGDALCIVSGALIALFYVAARRAREELPLDVFMGATMLVASATAFPVALAAGVPLLDYPRESWGWLLAIVIVTTLAGHGLLNLAARKVSLFELNLVIVLEPVLAIGLGALLFGARITPLQAVGGGVLAAAVIVGMQREPFASQDVRA